MAEKTADLKLNKQAKNQVQSDAKEVKDSVTPAAQVSNDKPKVEEKAQAVTSNEQKAPKVVAKKKKEVKHGILFKLVDGIMSLIISFLTYLWFGIYNLFLLLWKIALRHVFNELRILFYSSYLGALFLLESLFVTLPMLVVNAIGKYTYKLYSKIKLYFEKQKQIKEAQSDDNRTFMQKLNDYIVEKYENIPFVKSAREKKEASLMVLTIDPNSDDVVKSERKQTYKYIARNKEGKLETGYFAAHSKMDVYAYLTDKSMTVYEITTSWAINFFHAEASSIKRKMKHKDLIFWLAQLSTYIKAGIPLADAVKVLARQDKRRKYRSVYDAIIYELTMGESFSEALKKQGNVFPPLLINMIKSAEMIGNIEDTLDEMSDYYQEIEDTKKAIISALTYPSIILVFALGVVGFMLVYIVPKFVEVYESMNAQLNPITEITLNISAFIQTHYMNVISWVLAIVLGYILLYSKVKLFKTMMQKFFMKLPVVGNIIIYKEMSLFARTFATLNKNNVLLTDSIDILGKITNNEIYKAIMFKTINNLLKGEKMSESFKDHWAVPEVAYYMIVTGESTGELSTMLDKVGDYYQKLQRNTVNQIKTFIEPVMIVFLAVVVGFILVAIVVPMFGIYQTIQ